MHHHHDDLYVKRLVGGQHHHGDYRQDHEHDQHHHHGDDGSILYHDHEAPTDHDHWTTHMDAWLHADGAAYMFSPADHHEGITIRLVGPLDLDTN